MLPEVARVAESPAMTAASPAARDWLTALLQHGERAGAPEAVEPSPARRTGRRRAEPARVDRGPDVAGI
jgi:hypothetical protein